MLGFGLVLLAFFFFFFLFFLHVSNDFLPCRINLQCFYSALTHVDPDALGGSGPHGADGDDFADILQEAADAHTDAAFVALTVSQDLRDLSATPVSMNGGSPAAEPEATR